MRSVCVFCGSSAGLRPAYQMAARHMGEALARRGLRLVYGGGRVGLMGAVADAALAAGGEVVGVMPDFLVAREIAHSRLAELIVVGSMHERKARMAELADAFVALPGGYGTLEEFCEVLTWAQLGLHQKPHGLLNVADYFTPLLAFFDHAVRERFISQPLRGLVLQAEEPESLLDLLSAHPATAADKWSAPGPKQL